jgi:hypothetical protein
MRSESGLKLSRLPTSLDWYTRSPLAQHPGQHRFEVGPAGKARFLGGEYVSEKFVGPVWILAKRFQRGAPGRLRELNDSVGIE